MKYSCRARLTTTVKSLHSRQLVNKFTDAYHENPTLLYLITSLLYPIMSNKVIYNAQVSPSISTLKKMHEFVPRFGFPLEVLSSIAANKVQLFLFLFVFQDYRFISAPRLEV